MRGFLVVLIGCFCCISYGQETKSKSIIIEIEDIQLEKLGAPLSFITKNTPETSKYQLQKVDLSIDLREQYLRKKNKVTTMYLPENKFVNAKYNVAIPQPQTKRTSFSISGNGYGNSNTNSSGIKNIAYKDASLYSGAFCPITGLAY